MTNKHNGGSNTYCESRLGFGMFIIDEKALKMKNCGHDVILLTLGKSDLPLHSDIIEVMKDTLSNQELSNVVVPTGLPEFRNKIAEYYRIYSKIDIDPNCIHIDAGSGAIIRAILEILSHDDTIDEVLLPRPFYPLYKISADLVKLRTTFYSIDLHNGCVDTDMLKEISISDNSIIFIGSPGNPLGNIIDMNQLRTLLSIIPDSSYILIDEIYENTKFNENNNSAKILLDDFGIDHKRIIIVNSLSKAYRMYTKRVGWAVLPNELIGKYRMYLEYTRLTVDPAIQIAGIKALELQNEVQILNHTHRNRWEYTKRKLSKISDIRIIAPEGGFYCVLDCNDYMKKHLYITSFDLACEILNSVKVAVVPCDDFGISGFLRISFTNCRYLEAIDRLYHYFNHNS